MEEQFKHEDRILKQLIAESGLEKPTAGFNARLMQKIEAGESKKAVYSPLISVKGWFVVAVFVIAAVVLLYLYPSGILEQSEVSSKFGALSKNMPSLQFSKTVLYGILFLSLFIFQIPLLKRLIEPKIS